MLIESLPANAISPLGMIGFDSEADARASALRHLYGIRYCVMKNNDEGVFGWITPPVYAHGVEATGGMRVISEEYAS